MSFVMDKRKRLDKKLKSFVSDNIVDYDLILVNVYPRNMKHSVIFDYNPTPPQIKEYIKCLQSDRK